MRLLIDILQGVGLAGAAGMRPFLPALVAGAFARADVGIDYEGTPFAFLEAPAWLLAVVIAVVVVVILERRGRGEGRVESALQGIGIVLGALLCAATIADHYDLRWPGLIGGGLCAALAAAATRSLVLRTRARLDPEARAALPVYEEGSGMVVAAACILVPPLAILALGFFAWLLLGSRRRGREKFAGLRILR
jgi:chromate transport protein ChrA